jgi:hypothetical protein
MQRSVMRRLATAATATMVIALAWIGVALALSAPATTPLSYSTTFTDPRGTQKAISFSGTAADKSLSGTLTVDGTPVQVSATIGKDGSVSGTLLKPDGSKYGVFWGRPNGVSGMKGSFDLNGQVGDWSVPIRVPVPSTTSQ